MSFIQLMTAFLPPVPVPSPGKRQFYQDVLTGAMDEDDPCSSPVVTASPVEDLELKT